MSELFDFVQGQHYSQKDILTMYPALRADHLRYLEKCALIKPVHVAGHERFFGFTDLTALRQIAGELQQGLAFRSVVRNLQASRTGQLAFDFRLDIARHVILHQFQAEEMRAVQRIGKTNRIGNKRPE